ncbi:MAG: FKBP-type peptidyl-prolyl cis-trans isomerase [Muribaculaceae bacterium]|nr:FKBP-type peptidyl-prolyl cis-trans isomerase [Muribaculaceae bacterium]
MNFITFNYMNKKIIPAAMAAVIAVGTLASCNNGKKASQEDSLKAVEEMVATVQEAQAASTAKYGAAFFTNDANKSDAATDSTYAQTASGLKYVVIKEGTGKSPAATDAVTVHYRGTLTDGTVFDSSFERGEPITFPLNGVIKGWTEGLQLMKEGGTTIFYIPSDLAYGETGTPGGPIPPNAPLIFEVQLIQVQ